jgi:hypothetical protein
MEVKPLASEDRFMKLLIALTALLALTATSQAQIPFYGGYATLQPYYPGAIAPPYYPQAYYPQPYGIQPWYAPYGDAENQVAVYSNRESVDALERRVRQLTDEVRLLQDQVTATEAQLQTEVQRQQSQVSLPSEPAQPVIFILKNGKRLESQGYIIAHETLWVVTPSGTERISLSNLNVAATQRENLKRGIEFPNLRG